ncbi:MAG: PepSY-like domain-containing protein [Ignavibacteria bacterium]
MAFTYGVNAQKLKEKDVPSAVKTAFTAMYPDAKQIKWEMEDKKYEGEFKANNVESSALFEANGTYVQTETEIPVSSLPEAVSEYLSKNLAGKKIKEAAKITDVKGTVTYEAEVGGSDYLFDSNGSFLSKSTDSNDNDDEK